MVALGKSGIILYPRHNASFNSYSLAIIIADLGAK